MLDNVTQGFVTINRGAVPSVERSLVLDRWFGKAQPGQTLFDLFTQGDKDFAARSRLGWGEVVAAVMPLFLMLEQMPSDLVVEGTHYRVAYLPIGEGEEPEVEEGIAPAAADLARLRQRWEALAGNVERFVGSRQRSIEIDEADHAALELAIRRGAPSATLLRMVHSLKLEPTQRRLDHFAEQVRRIGARLDKNVEVSADSGGLRIDPKHWVGFWSAFIHAVRNAVDHGLETGEDRVAQGKPEGGVVRLRTYMRSDRFVVEIADDGRGIDWTSVAERAADLGLPAKTDEDLRLALFHGGVSTAARVTDLSGRGIGMSAVRMAVESLGGEVGIETRAALGTTLRMSFPKQAMSPDLGPALQALRPSAVVEIGA